jgi:Tfp pilus assembly protein PilV
MTTQRRSSRFVCRTDRSQPTETLPAPRARRGVTLVELLMSTMMLVVAVGGMIGSSASVARQMGGSMSQTVAAGVAQARLDSLTSLSCQELATGATTGSAALRGVTERWSVTDGRNVKTIDVQIDVPQRATPLRYRTVIPCRD